jgi:cob(I)alamin adenosyltransferase
MKIYTGTGDSGRTGVFGGDRVTKNHPRIEAYGTVDELNATIGTILATPGLTDVANDAAGVLRRIQAELFVVGADLATPLDSRADVPRVGKSMVDGLERDIDRVQTDLESLKTFILPGGSAAAASMHLARTVCRRAERRVVELAERDPINDLNIIYLNRLSDLLFVFARYVNQMSGCEDTTWTGR